MLCRAEIYRCKRKNMYHIASVLNPCYLLTNGTAPLYYPYDFISYNFIYCFSCAVSYMHSSSYLMVKYVVSNSVCVLSYLYLTMIAFGFVSVFLIFLFVYCQRFCKQLNLLLFMHYHVVFSPLVMGIGLFLLKLIIFTLVGCNELPISDFDDISFSARYFHELDISCANFMDISEIVNHNGEHGSTVGGPGAPDDFPRSIVESTERKIRGQCAENLSPIHKGLKCYDSKTWYDPNICLTRVEETCFTRTLAEKNSDLMVVNAAGKAVYTDLSGYKGKIKSDARLLEIVYPGN